MRRSGPHPRPLYFYLNQPNPATRQGDAHPGSPSGRVHFIPGSNRSITAIRIKCKCLRTSATRVLCKSTTPLVITEWKLMSSFVTNGPRKWTRIQERREREKRKGEKKEINEIIWLRKRKSIITSMSELSKIDWVTDWLTDWLTDCYSTCSFENVIVSLKRLWKEGIERGGGIPYQRGCTRGGAWLQ